MSNEITVSFSLAVSKGGTSDSLALAETLFSMTGTSLAHFRQEIGTSEEAIDMGVDIGTPGWFVAINRDATNFIEIRAGTGAADLVRMNPGEGCLFRLAADATAPFAIADTAACELEVLLIEA